MSDVPVEQADYVCNWDGCPFASKTVFPMEAHRRTIHDHKIAKAPYNRAAPGLQPKEGQLAPYENISETINKADTKIWADKPCVVLPKYTFRICPDTSIAIRDKNPPKLRVAMVNADQGNTVEYVEGTGQQLDDMVKKMADWARKQQKMADEAKEYHDK